MKFKFFKTAFLCVFCSHTALSFPLTGQWKSKYNEYFFFQDLEPNKKRGELITQRPNGKIVNKTYKILKQNSKNEWVISILNPLLKENKTKIENYSYSQKSKVINITGTISMKLMGKIHKSEYKYTLSRVSNATTPKDKQAKGYSAASKKRGDKFTKMLKAAKFVSQKKYTCLLYTSPSPRDS